MNRFAIASMLLFSFSVVSTAQAPGRDGRNDNPGQPKKQPTSPGSTTKRAFVPGEVDIHFLNGSTVRMVVQSEKLDIATSYGKLTVPVADLRAIEFGLHFPDGVEPKIEAAIKALGHSNYTEREKAGALLIDLGPYSYPAVLEATRGQDAETAQRAKELAKKLTTNHPKKDLKTIVEDKVVTRQFTIIGRILTPTIKSKTEYFGDVELSLAKMRTLRSLAGSSLDMDVAVDASKYANQGQWLDTGYAVDGRSGISITAKGIIDVWPQQGGQYFSGPNGFQAQQRGQPFGVPIAVRKVGMIHAQQHCGMLLGKIGEDGEIFIVGERYEGTPETEGKLFLHIGPSQWNVPSAGQFDVRITRKE
jgi:hypothetical protein